MKSKQTMELVSHNSYPLPLELCTAPNQHQYARLPKVSTGEGFVKFFGYQEYTLTRHTVEPAITDPLTVVKRSILKDFFSPHYLQKRTFLDLGANAGCFTFWALQSGAEKAIAVDMDETYCQMVQRACENLGFNNLEVVCSNISQWEGTGDVVAAFALIHWIFSCTSFFGSLDKAVEKLSKHTSYLLLIEWVEPNDSAIESFKHIEWNRAQQFEDYSRAQFETALGKHFERFACLGAVSATRFLYAAYKTSFNIDLSCPLPLLMDAKYIISCSKLASFSGTDYWSRVYDKDGFIYKQTSASLAERENAFLDELQCEHFPRVISATTNDRYSLIVMEKIHGTLLSKVDSSFIADPHWYYDFVRECFVILKELQDRRIYNRNIHADNIIVRDNKPVLVDFGWSVKEGVPCFVPEHLPVPPSRQPCDSYSLGETLAQMAGGRYPELGRIFRLMTEDDPAFRIINARTLLDLFECVRLERFGQPAVTQSETDHKRAGLNASLSELLSQKFQRAIYTTSLTERLNALLVEYEKLTRQRNELELENAEVKAKIGELESAMHAKAQEVIRLNSLLIEIVNCTAWKIASRLQSAFNKLLPANNQFTKFLKKIASACLRAK